MTKTDYWAQIDTNGAFEIMPAASSAPFVGTDEEHFTVYNHVVTRDLWMWYKEYKDPIIPVEVRSINYCATVLRSNFMEKKEVYSPIGGIVVFTSTAGGGLAESHIEQLKLFAKVSGKLLWRLNYYGNLESADVQSAETMVQNAVATWSL
jgi:hypothetical protein